MKFIVAPDSYKGSLTAGQVGRAMAEAIRSEIPEAEIIVVPMADGGEGTVAALVSACRGETVHTSASGPLGRATATEFGLLPARGTEGMTAVLEAANVCGLTMVPAEERNPLHTTSRGLGELVLQALDRGVRRIVVGLGGSATNDGGMGMLAALGAQFKDAGGQPLTIGSGEELVRVAAVDLGGLDPRLAQCELIAATDVLNPLCGPDGASRVYGPQKGATAEQVAALDDAMRVYAARLEAALGRQLARLPGAGAAGGLGCAMLALGAVLKPGAEYIAGMNGLRARIREADWVLTGEGRSDAQTLFGKLPYRVAEWSKEAGKPAVLISGSFGEGVEQLQKAFAGCFSIVPGPADLETCLRNAERNLLVSTRNIIRLLGAARGIMF